MVWGEKQRRVWVFHLYFQHEGWDVLCTCLSYACICSETDAFNGMLMEPLLSLMSITYMELCLKSSPPTFSVLFFQLLNGTGEFWGWDLSVSTGERLQDSIMDEHILVLGGSQSLGQLITYRMLLVCERMNSLSFSTQLLPIIAEQLRMTQLQSWHTKHYRLRCQSYICGYGHNDILLSGCWLIG